MDSTLPLLTVETVLFPGLVVPVPVNDVQNRAVVRDLQAASGASADAEMVCGALAIRDGYELGDRVFRSLHGIGCTALVSDVTGGDEGPMEITLTGNRRFRVVELDGDGDYLVAQVEWLPESAGSDPLGAASVALDRFRRYAAAVTEISLPGLHIGTLPDDPTTLSYLMSAAMVLLKPDRQKLLEVLDTTSRLAELVGLIDTELSAMAAVPSLPATDISWSDLAPN
ncbi:MAG TPA: LON peptidase substrate-binding domain-containing protein [Kribbellaceae bacterium]|nr:LON peptidase substrate-binding domain-containing protein [Kribbellaceae bacterium]